MDQIKQVKAGSALEKLICLHVYEHQLEGGDKDKERAKFRAEVPAEKRASRAILYSPILRAMFKAINAVIEGEWTPGDDAPEEIKAMAAILKAQGIVGLLADEPAAGAAAPTPAPAASIPLTVTLSGSGSSGVAIPVTIPLPAMTLPPFGALTANPSAPPTPAPAAPVLPPFPGFGG